MSSRAVGGIKELFFKILAGSLDLDRQMFSPMAEYLVWCELLGLNLTCLGDSGFNTGLKLPVVLVGPGVDPSSHRPFQTLNWFSFFFWQTQIRLGEN